MRIIYDSADSTTVIHFIVWVYFKGNKPFYCHETQPLGWSYQMLLTSISSHFKSRFLVLEMGLKWNDFFKT